MTQDVDQWREVCELFKADKGGRVMRLIEELSRAEEQNKRLIDLVRHASLYLHDDGLIDNDEFVEHEMVDINCRPGN